MSQTHERALAAASPSQKAVPAILSTGRTSEDRRERGGRSPSPLTGLNGTPAFRELVPGEDLTIGSLPPRLLLVVAVHQLSFYRYLARGFDGSDEVQVILDRRTADRRCSCSPPALERRRQERRSAVGAALLFAPGWLMTWSGTGPRTYDDAGVAPPSPRPVAAAAALSSGADHAREIAPSPGEPVSAEASDGWGLLTDEDQLRIESMGAQLDRDYANFSTDDGAPARDTERDPADRARDRRPAIVAILVGGLLAAALLAYVAVVVMASRARAVVLEAPASETAPTTAGREMVAAAAVDGPSPVDPSPSPQRLRPGGSSAPVGTDDERAVGAAAEAEVTAAFKAWVDTINRREVARHIAWYTDPVRVFYDARNVARSVVYRLRSRTFDEAARIDVQTSDPEIRVGSDGRAATMVFRKGYVFEGSRSNRRGMIVQELSWRKAEDGWRIVGERALEDGTSGQPTASKQPD